MNQTPSPLYQPGQTLDGFVVRCVTPIGELRSIAYELEHPQSGARILHLHNDDGENVFSVTFPTLPPDDSGVAHILEHAVLGGSRKYSVKDPFFEMIKCSMATFINAMTGSHYTVYPVASNVQADFFNLAEVYFDAVFHPTLAPETFQREGHHLEFATKGDPGSALMLKGIVYNEMKGAYSSPDRVVGDWMEKLLWPDTPLGKDSGGDPERIPDLTYEQFKGFHQTYYHPGNGYFFLYGDIPTAEHLKFLGPRLGEFKRREPAPLLPLQPHWAAPRRAVERYAVGPADPTDQRTFINLSFLVGDAMDVADVLALMALDLILLGNQAAPLRKAIIDSKLGEDVSHAGFGVNGRETSFHIGIKGSEADRTEAFEKLAMGALTEIAREGIAPERARAAFQQLAYRHLEISSSFGLRLMSRVTGMWLHGADPLAALPMAAEMKKLSERFEREPRLFSRLIEERLLNNTHRLTLTVFPDREIQPKKDAAFADKMKRLKESFSAADLQRVADQQERLDALLTAPNSPEALAALPQLKVRDLPAKPRHIPTVVEETPSITLLKNDVFANGVNYLSLSFDLSALPAELLGYLPIYSDCVGKMGAAGMEWSAVAQKTAAHTGGIGFSHAVCPRVDGPNGATLRASFSLKFLDGEADAALQLLSDLMFRLDCRDEARLNDVLTQLRSHHRSRPATDGLALALRHAGRGFGVEGHCNELWHGLPQTRLVEKLFSSSRQTLIEKLESVRAHLVQGARPSASFTGTDSVWTKVRKLLIGWTSEMKISPKSAPLNHTSVAGNRCEALAAPMNVAYCATVLAAPRIFDAAAPLLAVGARLVSYNHILEEVRFKGTAYGGGCTYSSGQGTWDFYSYRDPWIWRTLDVYRSSLDFVKQSNWSQVEIDRAIIGSAKEFERPIRPGEATGAALWRHLSGDTAALRESRHAALLRAAPGEVKQAVLDVFERGFPQAAVCVVSSRQKLEEANSQRPESLLEIEDILGDSSC